MQIVGDELKKLIVKTRIEWEQATEGIHIDTPSCDFDERQVTDDAIDLRIADHGYVMNTAYEYINTLSNESFESHFERIDLPVEGYVLKPGEVLYIGTIERIGLKGSYIGRISGRSTYSRLGLSISSSQDKFCGYNDAIVGLQLRNNSRQGLKIYPQQKLVQIMFYYTRGKPGNACGVYANESDYTLPQIQEKERFQYGKNLADKLSKLPSKKLNIFNRGIAKLKKTKKALNILNLILGAVFTFSIGLVNSFDITDGYKRGLSCMFFIIYILLSIMINLLIDTE